MANRVSTVCCTRSRAVAGTGTGGPVNSSAVIATPFDDISATNVQDQIEQLNSKATKRTTTGTVTVYTTDLTGVPVGATVSITFHVACGASPKLNGLPLLNSKGIPLSAGDIGAGAVLSVGVSASNFSCAASTGAAAASDKWQRPVEWPAMPTFDGYEEAVAMLFHARDDINYGMNFTLYLYKSPTGNILISWGDGTTANNYGYVNKTYSTPGYYWISIRNVTKVGITSFRPSKTVSDSVTSVEPKNILSWVIKLPGLTDSNATYFKYYNDSLATYLFYLKEFILIDHNYNMTAKPFFYERQSDGLKYIDIRKPIPLTTASFNSSVGDVEFSDETVLIDDGYGSFGNMRGQKKRLPLIRLRAIGNVYGLFSQMNSYSDIIRVDFSEFTGGQSTVVAMLGGAYCFTDIQLINISPTLGPMEISFASSGITPKAFKSVVNALPNRGYASTLRVTGTFLSNNENLITEDIATANAKGWAVVLR